MDSLLGRIVFDMMLDSGLFLNTIAVIQVNLKIDLLMVILNDCKSKQVRRGYLKIHIVVPKRIVSVDPIE